MTYLVEISSCLLTSLSDLTKMEQEKMQVDSSLFNVYEIVENSVAIVSFDLKNKGIELLCDIESDVPQFIVGDGARLRQILVNILNNAIKFSGPGEILLKIQPFQKKDENLQIQFIVEDHGEGIPYERQHLLFQPFTQADSSINRRHVKPIYE